MVRDEASRCARLLGVNVEITANKYAEKALVEANLELQQFAHTAGHDLQAPLRTISVFADLLEETLGSHADPATRHALDQVRNGSQRMRSLIGDLLTSTDSEG